MDGTDIREHEDLTAVSSIDPAPTVAQADASNGNGDAGMETVDGASLMEQFLNDPSHDYKTLKYGDVMDGIVMHVDREELLVDIGSKSEGIVPAREYSTLSSEERQNLAIGDTILVFVVQPENNEGHAVVSIDRARQEKSWRRLQELHEANEVIEAEVTNYNKGGLLVNLDGVRGFVPASQVSEIRGGDDASKQADMARLIGSMLPLKVIEINRHRNRLILSERQAIQERRDVMKERLIEELKEGEVRKGRVSSICDFGAFVDIGGADGLVHLSELSWSRVRHPSEVLRVGHEVDVYVLGINAQEKKIALSIKRTQAEPWSRVAAAYEVGQLVRGTVTQLANFGAFARIEDGIEGLIHVSELTDERITHPKQVVQEGQDLLLRIIRIDPQRRRMGLSLRRALDTPDTELVAVFGEEVLAERDRMVQGIRAALEAEGIEIGSGRSSRAEDEAAGDEPVAATQAPEAPAAEAPVEETSAPAGIPMTAAAQAAVEAERAEPRPQPVKKARPEKQQRPAADVPVDLEGEPLSAMAMAFAMAGALDDNDATADGATVAEVASDEVAAEQSSNDTDDGPSGDEPAAEAATGTANDDASTGEAQVGDQQEQAPGGSLTGTVAGAIGSIAGAVGSTIVDVASTVRSGSGGDAASAEGASPDANILPMPEVETEVPLESTADRTGGEGGEQ